MMQPLRTYDYLVTARSKIFDVARPLTPEQYGQEFPIGLGSLGRVLTHIMICEWYYVERFNQRDVPPYAQWPIRDESPPPFAELETEWIAQAARTRAMLSAAPAWDAKISYQVTNDAGLEELVTATKADLFTQLVLHEVHHRAQALNILRQLGAKVQDIDFNNLMYERQPAKPHSV